MLELVQVLFFFILGIPAGIVATWIANMVLGQTKDFEDAVPEWALRTLLFYVFFLITWATYNVISQYFFQV